MSSLQQSQWFLTASVESRAAPRIFCFPHAGGDSRLFLSWQPRMREAEIVAVCPPGRAHRAAEPRPASVAELADGAAAAIAAFADQPVYLFGHSLGAVVAFEVARRLRDLPTFRHLVASGCAAPALLPSPRVVEAAGLEGRAFAEAVGFFGGLPPEVVAAEELYDILLPGLRADFRMVASYQYRPAPPLKVPVTLIDGCDDPHVTDTVLGRWAEETKLPVVQHWVTGGHFYFEQQPQAVTDVLNNLLRDDAAEISAAGHSDMLI
jgi:surfactin synthase thioesterase subunit